MSGERRERNREILAYYNVVSLSFPVTAPHLEFRVVGHFLQRLHVQGLAQRRFSKKVSVSIGLYLAQRVTTALKYTIVHDREEHSHPNKIWMTKTVPWQITTVVDPKKSSVKTTHCQKSRHYLTTLALCNQSQQQIKPVLVQSTVLVGVRQVPHFWQEE